MKENITHLMRQCKCSSCRTYYIYGQEGDEEFCDTCIAISDAQREADENAETYDTYNEYK